MQYQFPLLANEYKFEEFIKDLFNAKYGTDSFRTYQKKGAAQHGIDVYSTEFGIYIQCKKKDLHTSRNLEAELIRDFDESLRLLNGFEHVEHIRYFYLATTAIKKGAVQDHAVKLATLYQRDDAKPKLKDIQYMDWENIEAELTGYPNVWQKYYKLGGINKLTFIPPLEAENVIGREDDLQDVKQLLGEERSLLLMNGMGGIGKTTLAKHYVHRYIRDYRNVAWITISDDFVTSMLSATELHVNLGLKLAEVKDPEQNVRAILNALNRLEGNNLLVIDNATQKLGDWKNLLPTEPWKVLITSRHEVSGIKPYRVGVLKNDKAIELYRKYHRTEASDDEIVKLLELVGMHTLTIELLANTGQNRELSVSEMLDMLEKKGLNLPKKVAISTDYEALQNQQLTIDKYVEAIFDMAEVQTDDFAIHVLRNLSIIPSQGHSGKQLLEFFLIKGEWEDAFFSILQHLKRTGWLEYNNGSYRCHQIVQYVVREKTKPTWENCAPMITFFMYKLRLDNVAGNEIDRIQWLSYGKALLKFLPRNDLNRAVLLSHLAGIFREMGDYLNAKKLFITVLEDFGPSHPNFATNLSNLGLVYIDLEDYSEAKKLLINALQLTEKQLGPKHPDVAIRQTNLATAYSALGDSREAKKLLGMALESAEKNYGPNHPILANRQANLAVVYRDLGEFEEAEKLLLAALRVEEKYFGSNHPKISTRYNNLAHNCLSQQKLEPAKHYFERALDIAVKTWGQEHPNTKNILEALDHVKALLASQ